MEDISFLGRFGLKPALGGHSTPRKAGWLFGVFSWIVSTEPPREDLLALILLSPVSLHTVWFGFLNEFLQLSVSILLGSGTNQANNHLGQGLF